MLYVMDSSTLLCGLCDQTVGLRGMVLIPAGICTQEIIPLLY